MTVLHNIPHSETALTTGTKYASSMPLVRLANICMSVSVSVSVSAGRGVSVSRGVSVPRETILLLRKLLVRTFYSNGTVMVSQWYSK